jgi:hypothetical protein
MQFYYSPNDDTFRSYKQVAIFLGLLDAVAVEQQQLLKQQQAPPQQTLKRPCCSLSEAIVTISALPDSSDSCFTQPVSQITCPMTASSGLAKESAPATHIPACSEASTATACFSSSTTTSSLASYATATSGALVKRARTKQSIAAKYSSSCSAPASSYTMAAPATH